MMNINETKVHPIEGNQVMLKLYMDHTRQHRNYGELQNFKKQIEIQKSGTHHKPFEAMLHRASIYRAVFMALGALFFFFTIFMHEQSINWLPYSYIFSNHQTAKNVVIFLCALFSASAFGMCFAITAEKEALYRFIQRTKRKLKRSYNKQRVLFELAHNDAELKKLKTFYTDAIHKVDDVKESVRTLLSLISKSDDQKRKGKLFNEALLEANDELHLIINKFRKSFVLKG